MSSFVLGATLRGLRKGGAAATAAVLMAALALLVAGVTRAGLLALADRVGSWRADLRVVLVLRDVPTRSDRTPAPAGVVVLARALPGVVAVRYVGPDEALNELQRLLGPRGEGLDRLPANPLPARLEVTPATELDAAGLRRLVQFLERLGGVEDVQAALDWIGPAERLERGLRHGGFTLAALLGLAALLAVAAATAAAGRARADETAILRLAGVSEARLRGPLVLQALVLGGAGTALGLGALLLVSEPGAVWVGTWLRTTLGLDPLPVLPRAWLVGLGGGGVMLGLTGAVATGRV